MHNELVSSHFLDIELVAAPPAELYRRRISSSKNVGVLRAPHAHAYLTVISRMNHEVSCTMDEMGGLARLSGIIVI